MNNLWIISAILEPLGFIKLYFLDSVGGTICNNERIQSATIFPSIYVVTKNTWNVWNTCDFVIGT